MAGVLRVLPPVEPLLLLAASGAGFSSVTMGTKFVVEPLAELKRYLVVWATQTVDKFVKELKSNPAVVVVSLRVVHLDVMSLVAHLDADEAQWGIILCRVAGLTEETVRRETSIIKCTSNN